MVMVVALKCLIQGEVLFHTQSPQIIGCGYDLKLGCGLGMVRVSDDQIGKLLL